MKSFALPLSPYAGIINRKLIYQNQRNKTIENFATKIEKKINSHHTLSDGIVSAIFFQLI